MKLLSEPHSPSTCAMSGGAGMNVALIAGIKGEPAPDPGPCRCPCRGCQRGECTQNGMPPMKPAHRARVVARFQAEARRRLATEKVLRAYELPEGRTPDSYRFLVEELYDVPDGVEDELLTDDPDEVDRLIGLILRGHHAARVTTRGWSGEPTQVTYGVLERDADV